MCLTEEWLYPLPSLSEPSSLNKNVLIWNGEIKYSLKPEGYVDKANCIIFFEQCQSPISNLHSFSVVLFYWAYLYALCIKYFLVWDSWLTWLQYRLEDGSSSGSAFVYSLMMPTAMAFLSASFLIFPLQERESKAKQVSEMGIWYLRNLKQSVTSPISIMIQSNTFIYSRLDLAQLYLKYSN